MSGRYFPSFVTFTFRHRYKTWRLHGLGRVRSLHDALRHRRLYDWYLPENWPPVQS